MNRYYCPVSRSRFILMDLCAQTGVTLIELMISMTLSLFVVMAATALLVSTKSGYIAQDDDAHVLDTGRYALEVISRSVRQAAYDNRDVSGVLEPASIGQSFYGFDARSLGSRSHGIASPVARSVNGSDVLAVRYPGSGKGDDGDGTVLNCAGFGVPAAAAGDDAEGDLGWSIFYVAEDSTGEPELYCKYPGNSGWSSQAIARGVESFQVLYGLDTDGDGVANRLLNATALNELDNSLVLTGHNASQRAEERRRRSHWRQVVSVKIALLVRGANRTREEQPTVEYDLFGKDYSAVFSGFDQGVCIREAYLPKSVRGRVRRIFTTTIRLRAGARQEVA